MCFPPSLFCWIAFRILTANFSFDANESIEPKIGERSRISLEEKNIERSREKFASASNELNIPLNRRV